LSIYQSLVAAAQELAALTQQEVELVVYFTILDTQYQ
jgi:hypothetical protein